MFQKLLISMAISALCKILGICSPDCPDGVCEELESDLRTIERKLETPRVGFGFSDLFGFVKCLDVPRFVAWLKEGVAIFNDSKMCVDDDDNVITLGAAPDPQDG